MTKATNAQAKNPPRRAPVAQRQRDAERSRRLLLGAALDVFAESGFAGGRVQEIADRAGVNKQLITYYFGGKEGLYRELQRAWREREAEAGAAHAEVALEELVTKYLHEVISDPRMMRLVVWSGLAEEPERPPEAGEAAQDTSGMRQRQERGELADDLDVGGVLLALMSAVAAPVAMPHLVKRIFAMETDDPRFEQRYSATLRQMIRHLAEPLNGAIGKADDGHDRTRHPPEVPEVVELII